MVIFIEELKSGFQVINHFWYQASFGALPF